jgi:hypothetical protein
MSVHAHAAGMPLTDTLSPMTAPAALPLHFSAVTADFSGNFIVTQANYPTSRGVGNNRVRRFDRNGDELTVEQVVQTNLDQQAAKDLTEIRLTVDGSLAVAMAPAAGATPDGTVGFKVDSNPASFDLIKVVSVTGSIARPDALFANSFE